MLLRRLTQHVKAQNWFAVGIDFVIVVIGVFIVSQWTMAEDDSAGLVRAELLTFAP